MVFKKGDYIEIGYGEYIPVENPLNPEDEVDLEVEDGGSYFVIVDQEEISESEIEALVPDNVLYIEPIQVDDKDARNWAEKNPPLSKMFVKEDEESLTYEEMEVVLPTSELVSYTPKVTNYIVKSKDKVVATVILDLSKIESKGTLYINHIEVKEKRKGYGKQIIEFLMDKYNVSRLEGHSASRLEAYSFWQSLGAKFYFIEEEGYIDIHELLDAKLESAFFLEKN